jgi:hypothetical protein
VAELERNVWGKIFSAKYENYWTAVGGARKYIVKKKHTGKY